MSVSEQEVKNQVAEMRAALDSIRASARIGSWVRILGVVVGLIIVGAYVWAFISLGKSVVGGGKIQQAAQARIAMVKDQLNLDQNLPRLAKEVGETYKDAGIELLKSLNVESVTKEELEAFLDDVQPIVNAEMERLRPQLEGMLRAEGDRLIDDVQTLVDDAVNTRLATILTARQMDLEKLAGTDSLESLVAQIRTAAEKAAEAMVSKRLARYQDDAEKIMDCMDRIPPLPGSMTQEELIHELTRALLARVRYALPDAQSVLSGAEG